MPRKKKDVSIKDTTAALLKEVEAMEAAKAADKPKRKARRKPKTVVPKMRVTKAVLKEREKVYKLVTKVWSNPGSIKHGNVAGYIKGIITYERGVDKETDHELIEELQFLIVLWRTKTGEY